MDNRYVALLRGVNVGGVKVLMQPLREMCEGFGWTDVKTYIASGNMVFRADGRAEDLAAQMREGLKASLGRAPDVLVMVIGDYKTIADAHPFNPEKGNQSHIYFCRSEPEVDWDLYHSLKAPDEELVLIDGHIHFHAPSGLGRSKLVDRFDKLLADTVWTGRNLNTVRKLTAMVEAL